MSAKDLLHLHILSDQRHVSTQQDHDLNLIVELEPNKSLRKIAQKRTASPHLGLILDCSGSMCVNSGNGQTYVDQMIECASAISDLVQDNDLISVEFFSTQVSEIHDVLGHDKSRLKQVIQQAKNHPYGNTNMAGALQKMVDKLALSNDRPRSILLFTDGGPSGPKQEVITIAQQAAKKGIMVNICGFNDELKLSYLSQIAAVGNGQTFRSVNQQELRREFRAFTQDAQQHGITDVILEFKLHPNYMPKHLFRGKPQHQYLRQLKTNERSLSIPLGSINAGSWQMILINGKMLGSELNDEEALITAKVSYSVIGYKERFQTDDISFNLARLSQAPRYYREIHQQTEMTLLKEEEQRFQKLKKKNNIDQALSTLKAMIQRYRQIGTIEANRLANQLSETLQTMAQSSNIQQSHLNDISQATSTATGVTPLSSLFHSHSDTLATMNRGRDQRQSQGQGQHNEQAHSVTAAHSRRGRGKRRVIRFDI